jgi:hypothetical protein
MGRTGQGKWNGGNSNGGIWGVNAICALDG